MTKHLLLTAAILSVSLPISGAFAESLDRSYEHRSAFSSDDAAAFTNARVAALKAGLQLTPAQEKNWPTLEAAIRDIAKARAARAAEWRDRGKEAREKEDLLQRLRAGGKALATRGAELEKLADAAKPLYDSLDEAQKRRFAVLLRAAGRPHGFHHWGGGTPSRDDDSDKDD